MRHSGAERRLQSIGRVSGHTEGEPRPNRKSDPSGRVIFSSAVDEALEDAREAVGLLEVREVSGTLEEHDLRPGEDSCARSA